MAVFKQHLKSINNIFNRISNKISKAFKSEKKVNELSTEVKEKKENSACGVVYFNGQELGCVNMDEIKLEVQETNKDEFKSIPMSFNKEFTFRVDIPKGFIRMLNRKRESERLFNILTKTKKVRTKKKLSKRILKNYELNLLEKF